MDKASNPPSLPQGVAPAPPTDWVAMAQSLLPKAKAGDARAQAQLSHAYLTLGFNAVRLVRNAHFMQALLWARAAAKQGEAFGQYNLAVIYEGGFGIVPNKLEAFRHYRLAAEQGHSAGQYSVGRFYLAGDAVTQNYAEARQWLMKAAAQDEAAAQNYLGLMHERGQGGPVDMPNAVTWYRRAADKGVAEAQVNLANIYASGRAGNPRDDLAAYFWYCVAVPRLGVTVQAIVIKNRDEVVKRLTAPAIERAQTLAAVWAPGEIDTIEAELHSGMPAS